MTCPDGQCVRGVISGDEVAETAWDKAVSDLEIKITDFNTRGMRQQVNHPGFVLKAKYCRNCGRKLDD